MLLTKVCRRALILMKGMARAPKALLIHAVIDVLMMSVGGWIVLECRGGHGSQQSVSKGAWRSKQLVQLPKST